MGITYRSEQDGRLSVQQMDDNFHYLEDQLAGLTSSNSGSSGTSGTSGINGSSGTSGTSGINGSSGTSGTSVLSNYKVYTALLTQSGGDNPESIDTGLLTIGRTYMINNPSVESDFTNVGAPNNLSGTYFVATGTTPNNWGTDTVILVYNTGAPVVTVLENTIGNVWFTYSSVGSYYINSNNLFINNKSTIILGNPYWETAYGYIKSGFDGESFATIRTLDFSNTSIDDNTLINTPIEIRVYN